MDAVKIARINELAKLSKVRALTPEELAEQKALREEYIAGYRANLRSTLGATKIERPDGTRVPLRPKKKP
jgi:uncharacterized protein YnzC (UPF0291/DUF896 family)